MTDNVNHPSHYNSHPSGVECIQVAEHMTFNCGNAVKYIWRNGLKDAATSGKQIEDLKKAIWYLQREVERLELETPAQKCDNNVSVIDPGTVWEAMENSGWTRSEGGGLVPPKDTHGIAYGGILNQASATPLKGYATNATLVNDLNTDRNNFFVMGGGIGNTLQSGIPDNRWDFKVSSSGVIQDPKK